MKISSSGPAVLIAHRGNIWGPESSSENWPNYVDAAISAGFDAEVDLWGTRGGLFLGHDAPAFSISMDWLNKRADSLWVHCKNPKAIEAVIGSQLNWFFHDRDDYTLTSKGFVWVFPGKPIPAARSIAVLFGKHFDSSKELGSAHGLCGDYVGFWRSASTPLQRGE